VIAGERGEILCALRSLQMSQGGYWEFPGGKIEPGETPEDSLRREIAEELGCTVAVGALVAEATHTYGEKQVRLRTYWARVVAGEPVPTEHERLAWVARAELSALRWAPADLPTVERLMLVQR
jgi:8-oxo-dGTP diphosphatase